MPINAITDRRITMDNDNQTSPRVLRALRIESCPFVSTTQSITHSLLHARTQTTLMRAISALPTDRATELVPIPEFQPRLALRDIVRSNRDLRLELCQSV